MYHSSLQAAEKEYESLLLSAGGGIQDNFYRAKQNDIPTLIIGLGGLGVKTLSLLKKKLHENMQPDYPKVNKSGYSHIRFLAIDADEIDLYGGKFEAEEILNIRDPYKEVRFSNPSALREMLMQSKYEWLSDEIRLYGNCCGSGAIRQIGRYQLIHKVSEVYQCIKRQIIEAIGAGFENAEKLIVHIVTGLSGGTGSGIFTDVCYITKKILAELGIHEAKVWGYAFLPDMIEGMVYNEAQRIKLNINAYAALKELDYLMNLENTGGVFKQEYGYFFIETFKPPVDRCYLISALDNEGAALRPNPLEYGMNVTADHIMAACMETEMYVENTAQITALNGNQTPTGQYQNYCIPGAAEIKLPVTKELALLAGIAWKKSNIFSKTPTDEEVQTFTINELHCTVSELKRMLTYGLTTEISTPKPTMDDVKTYDAAYQIDSCFINVMNDWLFKQENQLRKNLNKLLNSTWSAQPDCPLYFTDQLFYQLLCTCKNTQYGPLYVVSLLERNGITLLDQIQEMRREIEQWGSNAHSHEAFCTERAEEAKHRFVTSKNTFLNRRLRLEAYRAYIDAVEKIYRAKLNCIISQYMCELICKLHEWVQMIKWEYFHPMKCMLEKLDHVFSENDKYFSNQIAFLDQIAYENAMAASYTQYNHFPAQDQLDLIIENQDMEQFLKAFMECLENSKEKWNKGDPVEISQMINQFIADWFREYRSSDWDECYERFYHFYGRFCDHFYDPNQPVTPQMIEYTSPEMLFKPLYEKAAPCYWSSPTEVFAENTHECALLFVPGNAYHIWRGALDFQAMVNCSVQKSEQADRIAIQRVKYGVSINIYDALRYMKETYKNYACAGIHLCERNIDWKTLLPELVE